MIYPALLALGVFACAWIGWRTLGAPDHASRPLFLATALFGSGWTFTGLLVALVPDANWLIFCTSLAPIAIVPTYWFTMAFILSHIGVLPCHPRQAPVVPVGDPRIARRRGERRGRVQAMDPDVGILYHRSCPV